MRIYFGLLLILLLSFFSCQKKESNFQFQIELRNAQPSTFYLYRLSFTAAPVVVDSFHANQLDENFTLTDPSPQGEAIYQLSMPAYRSVLYFIADSDQIQVQINGVTPRAYSTQGSFGSAVLQHLQEVQNPMLDSLYILDNKISNHIGDEAPLRMASLELSRIMEQGYYNFADTTHSPLAALFIARRLDFGDDLKKQKQFTARMGRRFSRHPDILDYVQKSKDYFSLREIEYQIGDSLPKASFIDLNGKQITPNRWKGQYYLLEFWSSYCPPCLARLEQEKTIYQQYHPAGFNLIAFSLDEDAGMLNGMLNNQKFPWPVVADLKGWASKAINTYKIDSIPFNFLVGPNGKVAMKNVDAIRLDSVLKDWKKR